MHSVLLLSASGGAFAGYEFITCYDNEPFGFCTAGVTQDGEIPDGTK